MRERKGQFTKYQDDEWKVSFLLPSLKVITYFIFIFAIFLLWIVIGSKFYLLSKLFNFMDTLIQKMNKILKGEWILLLNND